MKPHCKAKQIPKCRRNLRPEILNETGAKEKLLGRKNKIRRPMPLSKTALPTSKE